MHPIKDEMAIVGSRIPYSSFTIWLFLSIEFVITMLLSIFLRILKIFKSLLPEPPRDLTGDVVLVRMQGISRDLSEYTLEIKRFES